jgi:hypothetical protein
VIEECRLVEVVNRRLFEKPSDCRGLLPEELKASFTARDLAEAAGISSIQLSNPHLKKII